MQLSYASTSWDILNHLIYLTSGGCVFALLNNFDEKAHRGTLRVELKENEGGYKENDGSGNLERGDFEEPVEMENEEDLEQNENESFGNDNHEKHNEDGNCNNDNQEEYLHDSFFSDVVFENVVCDAASSLGINGINIVRTEVLSQIVNSDNLGTSAPLTLERP